MKCKICGKEMHLEESDLDNPYIRYAYYMCEHCEDITCDLTWWGNSDKPNVVWYKGEEII